MRISPLQLQIQLQSLKQDQVTSSSVKVGDVLKALVLKIEPEQLTLALNNQETLSAKVQDTSRFVVGETLNFQVLETGEGPVKAQVFQHEVKPIISESGKNSLPLLKVEVTPESLKAFEVLKALDMPVTKENILTLTQNYKSLNIIHEEISNTLIKTPVTTGDALLLEFSKHFDLKDKGQLLDVPIKELAIETLGLEKNQDKPDVVHKPLETQRVLSSESPVTEVKENLGTDVLKSALGLMLDSNKEQLEVQDTMVKLSQLLQLDKPLTLNSLSLLDKLNFEFNLENQFDDLSKILEDMPKFENTKLLALLKGFDLNQLKNSQDVQSYFKVLMSELDDVKRTMSPKVNDQMESIKTSIKFLEQEQPQVTWVQIPVRMNDTTRNLDMFVKEGFKNKQQSNHKTKVLVALNTKHMALVQAFIEVEEKSLKISIKVENDEIKSVFDDHIKELKELLLEDKDKVDITVSSKVYMSYTDFVENENQGSFSMKV